MKIKYDLNELPPRRESPRQSEILKALKMFLASTHKNMCVELDDEKQAKNKLESLRNFRKLNNLQEKFDCYKKDKCVYVIRLDNKKK